MRTLLVTLFACILSFGLVAPDAEAKRFGGGKSFGKSFSTPKSAKPAAAPTSQKTATNTAGKTTQPKKRSGFGGLMAGLLAGGLLGAMFFGDGFRRYPVHGYFADWFAGFCGVQDLLDT